MIAMGSGVMTSCDVLPGFRGKHERIMSELYGDYSDAIVI